MPKGKMLENDEEARHSSAAVCRRSPNFSITDENMLRILFVDGLDTDVTENTIQKFFKIFGAIELVDLDCNRETQSSSAYIQFARMKDAEKTLKAISGGGFEIDGYIVRASLIGGPQVKETEEHEKGGPSTDPLDEEIIRLNQQLPSFYRSSISPDYDPKYVREGAKIRLNEDTDERRKYLEEVYYPALEASEGFDVPGIPWCTWAGMIRSFPVIEETREKLLSVANEGMEQYEKDNGIKYEVVEVEKCMTQSVAGFNYFIAFVAKRTGDGITDKPETFEAKVYCGIREKAEVDFCRKKDEEKMIGRKKMGRYELNCW